MVLTMISPRVKKRFPTLDNFVESGLMLENEKQIVINLNDKFPKPSKHWLVFFLNILYCIFKITAECGMVNFPLFLGYP